MLDFVFEPAFWAGLALLIGMEVVLGANNAAFLSGAVARLPDEQRQRVLRLGMVFAALFRLLLLSAILWVLGLERTAFSLAGWTPSWRELILLGGGLFLVYTATTELYQMVEHPDREAEAPTFTISYSPAFAIVQIVLINAAFSADSIIVAFGLTTYVQAMAIAIVAGIAILYFAAAPVQNLIARHPSIRTVALGLLLTVGVVLVAEGVGQTIPRHHLYWAMGFAILVLAAAKLLDRRDASEDIHPAIAASAVVPERAEPVLAPEPDEPHGPIEPTFFTEDEPEVSPDVALDEPEEEVIEIQDEELVPHVEEPPEHVAQPVEEQPEAPQVQIADEPIEAPTDEGTLGEGDAAVQKSRRKRPVIRRKPERPRTGRRRE